MAQIPFTYSAKLTYPPDLGTNPVDRPVALSGYFTARSEVDLELVGTGTQEVDFGTVGPLGAKVISIEVDPDPSPAAAAPVNIRFNDGDADGEIQVAPGGFVTIGNPKPISGGILSLTIVHTTNNIVRVRVLG